MLKILICLKGNSNYVCISQNKSYECLNDFFNVSVKTSLEYLKKGYVLIDKYGNKYKSADADSPPVLTSRGGSNPTTKKRVKKENSESPSFLAFTPVVSVGSVVINNNVDSQLSWGV